MIHESDRWRVIKSIVDGALQREPAARPAYIEGACRGDRALQTEVEHLVNAHQDAGSFLEAPAATLLGGTPDLTGRTIASYTITRTLGAGGMGQVYLATDAKLDRPVALKLLPADLAHAPDRLRRFHAEARSASSLNHPHILVIHDFGEWQGRPFMVTEYVEGQTLRQRIKSGPVAPREAIAIATQIASALSAAHERGIVHRDIKPENIMVRPDGYVKVLDFGLAKLTVREAVDVTQAGPGTAAGVIMGTPNYMSPEQARGAAVDFPSDQFSFGIVMYELVTGRSPFARPSFVETAAAVIADEPEPLDQLCPGLPLPLRWTIERCLAKQPDGRYASTHDLHRDLSSVHERLPDAAPHHVTLAESNLPVPGTPLVGRDADVAAVKDLLMRDNTRWVTLTGPGGVGKTRLSIQVAADLSADFGGAVYFIALAAVTDSLLVDSAIAAALGVRAAGGEATPDALKRHLGAIRGPVLLVLDNFEHVTQAAAGVAGLLDCSRTLKILVTSRSGMHVSAEREYQVAPLGLPGGRKSPDRAALAASPAVSFFVERATAARADFALTDDNASAVAAICALLDGLPLAIELAAARVKVLPPQALLARLEGQRLSLSGGARDLPVRQQALRNTIEWGYELLAPAEQRLFRRLAVFSGGWTLEAAEAVCDARQDLALDVLDGISSLVDKSLMRPVESGAPQARFTMLETIRDYALERLDGHGERADTHRAHAAYYLVLAEEGSTSDAEALLKWLELCEDEHANFRNAIDYLIASRDAEWAMRLTAALLPFWQARAHLAEGKDRLLRALALAEGAAPTELLARATMTLGTLLHGMGDFAGAAAIFSDRTLAAYRSLGDRRGIAVALNALSLARGSAKQIELARASLQDALSIWRELGDEQAAARTLSNLAVLALEDGDVDRAGELFEQVRSTCDRIGDAAGAAWAINFKAEVEQARGDQHAARALYAASLARFQAIGDTWGTGDSLLALAQIAGTLGDRAEARRLLVEAHRVFDAVDDIRGTVRVIEAFARLAAEAQDAPRALKFAGAAAAARQRLSMPLPPTQRQALDRVLDDVRQRAEGQNLGGAWMEGWSMSVDEAIQSAIVPSD